MTKDIIAESVQNDLRYLQLLARSFTTIADDSTEIIDLEPTEGYGALLE